MNLSNQLVLEIKNLIASAKENAVRAVDFQRTLLYWHIGERIFNEEQQGKERAGYGEYLIKYLSEQLQPEFGSGFSYRQLNQYRQFYKTFPIVSTLRTQLSWSHYKSILSINNEDKREYYIAETTKNNWSVRQMVM
jgi:DUF1016 N-terminal domain